MLNTTDTSSETKPNEFSNSGSDDLSPVMSKQDKEKYVEKFSFPHCYTTNKYETIAKVGQGTFGEVFKAKERSNPEKVVAMKKIMMENEKEGFPVTALREIRILQLLKHENIVNFIEICRTQTSHDNKYCSTFYLVFDFCEHDLAGLLSNLDVKFTLGEIKNVLQQLLNGIYYLHGNKILHRDVKAANVLITKSGVLKLADFGLSRAFRQPRRGGTPNRYTNRVVTLWYRAPELLLGERNYGPPVDMWSVGCIMAEMWTRKPIFQGNSEQQQLKLISQLCGSITPQEWPGVEDLKLYNQMRMPQVQKRIVKEHVARVFNDPYACDLFDRLLVLDPAKRIDADTALDHDFFWTDPMPYDLGKMMSRYKQSMFEYSARQKRIARKKTYEMTKPTTSNQDSGYYDRVF